MTPGWLISLLVLVPNLILLMLPPRSVPAGVNAPHDRSYQVMEIIERIGQIGCFVTPAFYILPASAPAPIIPLVVMGGALFIYYAGWLRYVLLGREYKLLFNPLLGMPLPMASAPVLYFMAAAALLGSWLLFAFSILLGMGHLYISRQSRIAVLENEPE